MAPVVPVPIEPVPPIDPVVPVLLPPIEPVLPPIVPVEPVPIEPVPPIVLVAPSAVEPVLDVDPVPVDEPLRPERRDERVLLRAERELAPVVLWPAVLPLPIAVSTDVEPVLPPIEPEDPPVLV